jgi:S1-C subfamily serine protease
LAGESIPNYNALTGAIGAQRPGDKVTVTVENKGSTRHVTVTLGSRPASTSNNCSNQ